VHILITSSLTVIGILLGFAVAGIALIMLIAKVFSVIHDAVTSLRLPKPAAAPGRGYYPTTPARSRDPEMDWLVKTCRELGIDTNDLNAPRPASPSAPVRPYAPADMRRREDDYRHWQQAQPGSYRPDPAGLRDRLAGHRKYCRRDEHEPGGVIDRAFGHSDERCYGQGSFTDRALGPGAGPAIPDVWDRRG
jgi:hypothetical protein